MDISIDMTDLFLYLYLDIYRLYKYAPMRFKWNLCVCVFRVSWWWRASGVYGRASRLNSPSRGRVKVWSRSGSRGPAGAHARAVTDAPKGRPRPSNANQRETGECAEHDGICSFTCYFQLFTWLFRYSQFAVFDLHKLNMEIHKWFHVCKTVRSTRSAILLDTCNFGFIRYISSLAAATNNSSANLPIVSSIY